VREELQIDGLRETSAYIHELLRQEIKIVGSAGNVVLGGLSQGCAASLISLLLWDGEPLAAAVGMCGWLPFRTDMENTTRGVEDIEVEEEDFNPFANPEDNDNPSNIDNSSSVDPPIQAVAYLREELGIPVLPSLHLPFQRTPLFLGHGSEDEKVPVKLGREAASCLSAMTMDVSWKEYEALEHWYSASMLQDLVDFVRERAAWELN
jgi:predicted esterase